MRPNALAALVIAAAAAADDTHAPNARVIAPSGGHDGLPASDEEKQVKQKVRSKFAEARKSKAQAKRERKALKRRKQ